MHFVLSPNIRNLPRTHTSTQWPKFGIHFVLSPNIRNLPRTHTSTQKPHKGLKRAQHSSMAMTCHTITELGRSRHSFHTCLVIKLLSLTREVTPDSPACHHSLSGSEQPTCWVTLSNILSHTHKCSGRNDKVLA